MNEARAYKVSEVTWNDVEETNEIRHLVPTFTTIEKARRYAYKLYEENYSHGDFETAYVIFKMVEHETLPLWKFASREPIEFVED